MNSVSLRIGSTLKLLLFVSLLFPVMGTILGIPRGVLIHFPIALLLLIWFFIIRRGSFTIRYDWTGISFLTIFALLPIQYLSGRGFGTLASGGYVVLCAIVLLNIFNSLTQPLTVFVHWISLAYKFVLVMLLIEASVVVTGSQPRLTSAFSPEYRDYMSADIPRLFGLMENAGGLNSILLDAQLAGMLSLSAAIWFISAKNLRTFGEQGSLLWIGFAIFMYLFSLTGTVAVLSILAIFLLGLVNFRGLLRWLWFFTICIIAAGVTLLALDGKIFKRVFNDTPLIDNVTGVIKLTDIGSFVSYGVWSEIEGLTIPGFYLWAFTSPIRRWLDVDLISKLIGVEVGYFDRVYVSGDFGLGYLGLQSGAVGVFVFVANVLSSFLAYLRLHRSSDKQDACYNIGVASSVISVVLLFSMAHYSAAFTNPGCIVLFSIHLALAYYCRYKIHTR